MRVLTQNAGLTCQIRPQRQRSLGDGSIEITSEPIYVKFKSVQAGAFLYETEEVLALKHFMFPGNTQDIGEAIPTSPIDRVAICDTDEMAGEEGWDPETKAAVEERLRQYCLEDPSTFLLVTATPMAAPFPNYDLYEGDAQALVVRLIEDGYDVEDVLRYEVVFGRNRPDIVAKLEAAVEVKKELTVTA